MSHDNSGIKEPPTKKFVFITRLTELVCALTTVATLGYTADGHKKLWGDVPTWLIVGIAVGGLGSLISFTFMVERKMRYPIVEAVSSSILSAGFIAYTVLGAINTDPLQDCEKLDGRQRGVCAAPKAAEFFAFINMFAYAFSAGSGLRVYYYRKNRSDDPSDEEALTETAEEKKAAVENTEV